MTTIRKRRLSPQPRRTVELLRLLASSPHGATEQRMLAHGFTRRMLTWLVRPGLALRYRMPLRVSGRTIEVTYVMITDAGRRALERMIDRVVASTRSSMIGPFGAGTRRRRRALDSCVGLAAPGAARGPGFSAGLPEGPGLCPAKLPSCHNSERAAAVGVGLVRGAVRG
jgi:hypothetical protein